MHGKGVCLNISLSKRVSKSYIASFIMLRRRIVPLILSSGFDLIDALNFILIRDQYAFFNARAREREINRKRRGGGTKGTNKVIRGATG